MPRKKLKKKMFIVRHRVLATNLMDARRQAKKSDPDEIFIDQEWAESGNKHLAEAIGFHEVEPEDDDEYYDE